MVSIMLDNAVLEKFVGRAKKIGCLPKTQARLVVEWLSQNEGEWEESQIYSYLEDEWGYGGLQKGSITFFCRCFKDTNGKNVFNVEGRRPRKIQFLPPSER